MTRFSSARLVGLLAVLFVPSLWAGPPSDVPRGEAGGHPQNDLTILLAEDAPDPFSPNADEVKDANVLTVTYRVRAKWGLKGDEDDRGRRQRGTFELETTWRILDSEGSGAPFRTIVSRRTVEPVVVEGDPEDPVFFEVTHDLTWDGLAETGEIPPDAVYPYEVSGRLLRVRETPSGPDVPAEQELAAADPVTGEVLLDVTPPEITRLFPEDGFLTNDSGIRIEADFTDALAGVDVSGIRLEVDGEEVTTEATVTPTGLLFISFGGFAEGVHEVFLEVPDLAGNRTQATASFTVDVTSPDLSIDPEDEEIVDTVRPEIRIFYSDLLSGVDLSTLRVFLDGADRTADFDVGATEAVFQVPEEEPFDEGLHEIVAEIADRAGNAAMAVSVFEVRTLPPDFVPPRVEVIFPFLSNGGQVFEGTTLPVLVSAVNGETGIKRVALLVDGEEVAEDVEFPYEFELSIPAGSAGDTLEINALAEDNAGNIGVNGARSLRIVPFPAAGAVAFEITGVPTDVDAGDPLSPITLRAVDGSGNTVTDYFGFVSVTSRDWTTFVFFSGFEGGEQTIAVPPLTSARQNFLGASDAFVPARFGLERVLVHPGPAAQLVAIDGFDRTFRAGRTPDEPVVVEVRDPFGNPVGAGERVRLEVFESASPFVRTAVLDEVTNEFGRAIVSIPAPAPTSLKMRIDGSLPERPLIPPVVLAERFVREIALTLEGLPEVVQVGVPFDLTVRAIQLDTGEELTEGIVRIEGLDDPVEIDLSISDTAFGVFFERTRSGGFQERRIHATLVETPDSEDPIRDTGFVTVQAGPPASFVFSPQGNPVALVDVFGNGIFGARIEITFFRDGLEIDTMTDFTQFGGGIRSIFRLHGTEMFFYVSEVAAGTYDITLEVVGSPSLDLSLTIPVVVAPSILPLGDPVAVDAAPNQPLASFQASNIFPDGISGPFPKEVSFGTFFEVRREVGSGTAVPLDATPTVEILQGVGITHLGGFTFSVTQDPGIVDIRVSNLRVDLTGAPRGPVLVQTSIGEATLGVVEGAELLLHELLRFFDGDDPAVVHLASSRGLTHFTGSLPGAAGASRQVGDILIARVFTAIPREGGISSPPTFLQAFDREGNPVRDPVTGEVVPGSILELPLVRGGAHFWTSPSIVLLPVGGTTGAAPNAPLTIEAVPGGTIHLTSLDLTDSAAVMGLDAFVKPEDEADFRPAEYAIVKGTAPRMRITLPPLDIPTYRGPFSGGDLIVGPVQPRFGEIDSSGRPRLDPDQNIVKHFVGSPVFVILDDGVDETPDERRIPASLLSVDDGDLLIQFDESFPLTLGTNRITVDFFVDTTSLFEIHMLVYEEDEEGVNDINPGPATNVSLDGLRIKPDTFWITQKENLENDALLSESLRRVRATPIGRLAVKEDNGGFETPVLTRFLIRASPGNLFQTIDQIYLGAGQSFRPPVFKTVQDTGEAPFLEAAIRSIENDPDMPLSERIVRLDHAYSTYIILNGFREFVPSDEVFVEEITGELNLLRVFRSDPIDFETSEIVKILEVFYPQVYDFLVREYVNDDTTLGGQRFTQKTVIILEDIWRGEPVDILARFTRDNHRRNVITIDSEETSFGNDRTRSEFELATLLARHVAATDAFASYLFTLENPGDLAGLLEFQKARAMEQIGEMAQEFEAFLGAGAEIVASAVNEPVDFVISFREVRAGNYAAAIGFIPIIPGAISKGIRVTQRGGADLIVMRKLDDVAGSILTNLDDAALVSKARLLDEGGDLAVVRRTFMNGQVNVFRTSEPITAFRVIGGESKPRGPFLTFQRPSTRQQVIDGLALPPENAASGFIEFQIPAEQVVFIGRAEPNFGHAGGGTQIFVEQDVLDAVLDFNNVASFGDFPVVPLE